MIRDGRYFVWFNTPIGEGAAEVDLLPNGDLKGRDTTFAYTGHWAQIGDRFKAEIHAKRVAPGPPGVFGMNEIDIVVRGLSTGDPTLSGTGFAKQSPALKLSVMFNRIGNG